MVFLPISVQDFRSNLRPTPKGPIQESVYGARIGVRPAASGPAPNQGNGMGRGRGMPRSQTYAGTFSALAHACYLLRWKHEYGATSRTAWRVHEAKTTATTKCATAAT